MICDQNFLHNQSIIRAPAKFDFKMCLSFYIDVLLVFFFKCRCGSMLLAEKHENNLPALAQNIHATQIKLKLKTLKLS